MEDDSGFKAVMYCA